MMTWWVVDNAIRESVLPPPCRLVLRTLADQINPPQDWDHRQPEAWDPSTHEDDLAVWCDRETLSHATGYGRNTLRLIMVKLVHDYGVLRLVEPARQHYTAHWRLDLEALRGWRDPWFEQRATERQQARPSRRRRSAPSSPATMAHSDDPAAPAAAPADWAPAIAPPKEPAWEREWKRRYEETYTPSAIAYQRAQNTPADENQGAQGEPSHNSESLKQALSDARGPNTSPCFTSSSLSPHDSSPQAGGGDFQSQEEGPAPGGAAGSAPAKRSLSVATPADTAGTLATDHGPPGELSAFVRQMIARQGLSPEDERAVRRQLIAALRPLDSPNGNGHGHKSLADYDAERQRQFAAARAAGLDIGERGHSDHGADHHREGPAGGDPHRAAGIQEP